MNAPARPLNAKAWERQAADWYVEEPWVSRRLFDVEEFASVWDPACGRGNIITGGTLAGVQVTGTDLIGRNGRAGGDRFPDDGAEIICGKHWRLASATLRRRLTRLRRLERRLSGQKALRAESIDWSLWNRIKAQVIQRAAGL